MYTNINETLKLERLEDITFEKFEKAAYAAMAAGHIGMPFADVPTGTEFLLFGDGQFEKKSVVSLQNDGGSLRLLVTDVVGRYLVCSQFNGLSAREVVQELYRQFLTVRHLVQTEAKPTFSNIEDTLYGCCNWREKRNDVDAVTKAFIFHLFGGNHDDYK